MLTVSYKPLYFKSFLIFSCNTGFLTQTKEIFMKALIKLPIYTAIIFIIIACLCSNSHAWEHEYIGVSGIVQDEQRRVWVDLHQHKHEPIYLDPVAAIAEQEYGHKIDKSGEVYEHQKDKEFEQAVRRL